MSGSGQGRIHFGALDLDLDDSESSAKDLSLGVQKGNVNVSTVESETLDLSSASIEDQEKHAEALRQFEEKRRSKSIVVPTDDAKVKHNLRGLGQPICLFGEGPGDRRNRLRLVIARMQTQPGGAVSIPQFDTSAAPPSTSTTEPHRHRKTIYTPASKDLVRARREIASFSWGQAKQRLQRLKRRRLDREAAIRHERSIADTYSAVRGFAVEGSQFGDRRPLSCCEFLKAGGADLVATGSFAAGVSIWSAASFAKVVTLNKHEERVVDVGFCPRVEDGVDHVPLCSAGADSVCYLWRVPLSGGGSARLEPMGKLEGHKQRLSKLAWHPNGGHVATSSYDTTWRLWDASTCKELLLQDGHEAAVYGIAFHPDGSLLASADLNGIGRVWDVRSGKSIYSMTGHAKQILTVDFSANGYHVATGSGDHTCRVYDLRQQKVLTVIPGHSTTISRVRFSPENGSFLLTAGYDAKINLWNARDFSLLKTLEGHEGKIMDIDISKDEKRLLSCSYDKTWKIWQAS